MIERRSPALVFVNDGFNAFHLGLTEAGSENARRAGSNAGLERCAIHRYLLIFD